MAIWRLLLAAFTLTCAAAWGQQAGAELSEQVLMVPKTTGLLGIDLETTLYKPEGNGPFPIVVINHGKAYGDTRFQDRYRPSAAVRFFLQRGYAAVVPMRQGFSKSGGSYVGGGCNVQSNGLVQAEDVKTVLDWATAQGWADKSNVLVLGQSHGGWTTLAFGTQAYPGVKGLVNFAGGLRQDQCAGWQGTLARAAGAYGAETRVPSLWFYGDNDSYFDTYTYRSMYESYRAAGAPVELVAFGVFGNDAHSMFSARSGESIWQPPVDRFLRSVGLPSAIVQPRFAVSSRMPTPPRTDFAAIDALDKLPHVRDAGREGYRSFLGKQFPRAFAIAPSGAWGWAEMGDDPLQRALSNCQRHANKAVCRLYAVDDQVVWLSETKESR